MRREHQLRPNKLDNSPTHFVFFDTEAYLQPGPNNITYHTFRLGYAQYVECNQTLEIVCQKNLLFKTPDEFVDFLESVTYNGVTVHTIAHNISYDAQIIRLPDLLHERGWEQQGFYIDGQTVVIPFRKGDKRIILEDGLNRLRGSIEAIGALLGLPKLHVDFSSVSDEELATYCQRDVHILAQATLDFIRFAKEHNFGRVAKTLAGQALAAFRHRFMHHKIYIHSNKEVLALERQAYKGGLVRVFRVTASDNGTFHMLDVNSMYPYVMLSHKYPTKLITLLHNPPLEQLKRLCDVGAVVARLTVKPTEDCFPHKHLEETIYPIYPFTDVFTTPEVQELIRQDAILEVHEVAVYKTRPIFTDYVNTLYAMRKKYKAEGNLIYSEICKLLLNGLYGKFAAYNSSWKREPDLDFLPGPTGTFPHPKTGKKIRFVKWGDQTFIKTVGEEAYNSFPAIAAHITAYARLYLWSLIRTAGRENVYYCDTDSLIVNETGLQNLKDHVDPSTLGKLKLETSSPTLIVLSRKDYILGDDVTRKGVKISMTTQDPTYNPKEVWPTLTTFPKRTELTPYSTQIKLVNLKRVIKDGTVSPDGTILPFSSPPSQFLSSLPFLMSIPTFNSLVSVYPTPT